MSLLIQKNFRASKLRLFSVFSLVSLIILFISMRAWFSFSSFADLMRSVIDDDVKAQTLAYQLSEEASLTTQDFHALYSAKTNSERMTAFAALEKTEEKLNEIITALRQHTLISNDQTHELMGAIKDIRSGSQELNLIVQELLEKNKTFKQLIDDVSRADRKLLEFIAPLIDDAEFGVAMTLSEQPLVSNTPPEEGSGQIYSTLTTLLSLKERISLMYSLFLEAHSVNDPYDLQPLQERFIATHHHANVTLKELSTHPAIKGLNDLTQQFANYGRGQQNLFILRGEILTLQQRGEQNIHHNGLRTRALSKAVEALTDAIEETVQNRLHQTDQRLSQEKLIIIISNIVAFLCALAVAWLYSKTSLQFQRQLMSEINERKKAEEDMLEAKNKAIQSSQVKSEFLAVMSHEIRTPMNSIVGFSKLLLAQPLEDKSRDFAHTIQEAASALSTILEDILVFSKLESGKVDLESIPVALHPLLQDVVTLFQLKAAEQGIELDVMVQKDVPEYVLGDPSRLRQIIINLLSNAIKFTHEGGIYVSAEVKGKRLLLSVRDTGIGISEEAQARLFNKFEQADSSTTRKYGGIGLGLAITKKLITLMQGKIWVTSEVGKGTTFWVDLPLEKAKKSLDAEKRQSKLSGLKSLSLNKHILVAEDNPFNQKLISELLKRIGYPFTIVENGQLAVEAVEQNTYDLVFMDMQMPVLGGLDATRAIRSLKSGKGHPNALPIVALSANAMKEDIQKCLDAGMQAHLEKPLDHVKLENILYDYLEESSTDQ